MFATVTELWRYPVKSLLGEQLQEVQVEEAVESTEASRRLPASELAVAVGDGVEPIADDAALIDLHLLKLLAQERFHRVAPKLDDGREHQQSLGR